MDYQEYSPIPALALVVERIWTLSGDAASLESGDQPVLPDGRPEIILHLGEAFARLAAPVAGNGRTERQPFALVAGQLTSALTLRPTGRIRVLGIRLRPYGVAAFGIGPADRLLDVTADAAAFSSPLGRLLGDVRDMTDDLPTAAHAVQQRLALLVDPTRIDSRLRRATHLIRQRRGLVSIDAVATEVGWSRRSLERGFLDAVGIAPKRLARIARFQHALQVLDAPAGIPSGAATAAACGYADQAHFVRDFREFAGCPPGEHLLRRAELMRFFVDRAEALPQAPVPYHAGPEGPAS